MWFACCPLVVMPTGLVVYARAAELAASTRVGSIAHYEAERAVEAGSLLGILTAPWLVIGAVAL